MQHLKFNDSKYNLLHSFHQKNIDSEWKLLVLSFSAALVWKHVDKVGSPGIKHKNYPVFVTFTGNS